MIVSLNGYVLNDPAQSIVVLNDPIEGLSLPKIRSSTGNYAGRDGGYMGAQFYSARTITLQGTVFSSSVTSLEEVRRDLQTALRSKDVTLRLVTNAGASYLLYCKLLDFTMPIRRDLFMSMFKIELYAPDPTIYDNTAGGVLTASIYKQTGGGYTYPVVYPVIYSAGSGPTTVTNGGTVDVFPTVTLVGNMTNPIVINVTTGLVFSLTGISTAPGDIIVIDMRARTVTLNGGSIFARIGGNSSWWSLQPGGNDIGLTSSGGSDSIVGTVSWRSGYMGI